MPAAVRPRTMAPSVTPMPPGIGMMPANSATETLTTRSVASDSDSPNAASTMPSVIANRVSAARLPSSTCASFDGDRNVDADVHPNVYADKYSNGYVNADGYFDGDQYSDKYADRNSDVYEYSDIDAHQHTNGYTEPYPNSYSVALSGI